MKSTLSGRHRGAGLGGGHDEREQTLNQLLVEMDGFESNEGVILVAATNRPDVLDPALLRPGRFDRRVVVGRPDVNGREQILKVHTKKVPLGDDVDLSVLGRGTPGLAGADLANLVNEAALNAARQNRKVVMMIDFELAKDKILMGAERRSMILSDSEKRTTAYHEAGHAIVAVCTPNADPLHKVSIIPRGMALGVTMQLPTDDKHNYSKVYCEDQLAIMMGGRIAEEIYLNQMTTGAGQRHRAGYGNGAQDGLRVGHERTRSAELRQEGRADLPRPRDFAASRLLGSAWVGDGALFNGNIVIKPEQGTTQNIHAIEIWRELVSTRWADLAMAGMGVFEQGRGANLQVRFPERTVNLNLTAEDGQAVRGMFAAFQSALKVAPRVAGPDGHFKGERKRYYTAEPITADWVHNHLLAILGRIAAKRTAFSGTFRMSRSGIHRTGLRRVGEGGGPA